MDNLGATLLSLISKWHQKMALSAHTVIFKFRGGFEDHGSLDGLEVSLCLTSPKVHLYLPLHLGQLLGALGLGMLAQVHRDEEGIHLKLAYFFRLRLDLAAINRHLVL